MKSVTKLLMWLECCIFAFAISNSGRTFYIAFTENRVLAEYPIVRLYLTSLLMVPVAVKIQMPFLIGFDMDYLVDGLTLTILPQEVFIQEFNFAVQIENIGYSDKGMIIQSDGDISVFVGQINDLSSDVYLAFPMDSLTTDYYIMTYIYTGQSSYKQGPTQIAIVSTADSTTVEITLPNVSTQTINELIDARIDCDIGSHTCNAQLDWAQTLQLQSSQDLTGTRIQSSNPISVFAGTVWTSVGAEFMGDHMIEQVPPTSTWGGEFIVIPVVNRTSGDIIRILGKENDTHIIYRLYPSEVTITVVIDEAKYKDFELPTESYAHILADKPILVAQFTPSNGADNFKLSDPFMTYIPPTTQYRSRLSFSDISSLKYPFCNSIALVTNVSDVNNNLLINNKSVMEYAAHEEWKVVPGTNFKVNTLFLPLQDTVDYSQYYRIHTAETRTTVGGILYGLKFQEAFATMLGMNLNDVQQLTSCFVFEMQWQDSFDNDCDGLVDEEIANNKDDDNDGKIDEDVFSDTETRQQYNLRIKASENNTMTGPYDTNLWTKNPHTVNNDDGGGNTQSLYSHLNDGIVTTNEFKRYVTSKTTLSGVNYATNSANGNNYNTIDINTGNVSKFSTQETTSDNNVLFDTTTQTKPNLKVSSAYNTHRNVYRNTHSQENSLADNGLNKMTVSSIEDSGIKQTTVSSIEDASSIEDSGLKQTTVSPIENASSIEDSGLKHTTVSSIEDAIYTQIITRSQILREMSTQDPFYSNNVSTDVDIHVNSASNDTIQENTTAIYETNTYNESRKNLPNNETMNIFETSVITTPGSKTKLSTKSNFLQDHPLMIIIPASILFGIPLVCCLCMCLKPMILSFSCDRRKNKDKNKVTPEDVSTKDCMSQAERQKKMLLLYENKNGDILDCRRDSTKPDDFIFENSSKRKFTSKQCKNYFKHENDLTNTKSLYI